MRAWKATRNGTVKKTPLTEYAYQLQRGTIAINLDQHDALVDAQLTDGGCDVMLFASNGMRFAEYEVRVMGRSATGVRGMKLAPGEEMCDRARRRRRHPHRHRERLRQAHSASEYPRKGRGTQGVILMRLGDGEGCRRWSAWMRWSRAKKARSQTPPRLSSHLRSPNCRR